MDGNHGLGCALLGLALTSLLVRLVGMSSPPFNSMNACTLSKVKATLVLATVVMMFIGSMLISRPLDPAVVQRLEEESFQFH